MDPMGPVLGQVLALALALVWVEHPRAPAITQGEFTRWTVHMHMAIG